MRKDIIKKIINDRPDAVLVKNKYKVLVGMIKRMYPLHYDKIPNQVWQDIAYDLINGDRDWRLLTEGQDKDTKKILSQQYILDNIV